ncbi:MAG: phytoene dehydrogenase, partial [Planctomycetia bacterium]|nr:phytoene dehydrogenase [Planctomycetia bacterium]
FRSIFLEGFGRPRGGVRQILSPLLERFRGLGGELRLKTAVRRLIVRDRQIEAVLLDDGSELRAKQVLSSAGWPETLKLCDEAQETAGEWNAEGNGGGAKPETGSVRTPDSMAGELAFTESIAVLDQPPEKLGITDTVTFFSHTPVFHYEPADCTVDLRSGVICCPDNYHYDKPLDVSMVRITSLAGYDAWNRLSAAEYRLEKGLCFRQVTEAVTVGSEWGNGLIPDFRSHVVDTDLFTPRTVRRFTGRIHGAIYGAPEKRYDGRTHLKNLFLCGTDQGMVGIIGTLISGIMMANRYCLETS